MPIKLSNFNFFILKDRDASVSRPLHMWGIFLYPAREMPVFPLASESHAAPPSAYSDISTLSLRVEAMPV